MTSTSTLKKYTKQELIWMIREMQKHCEIAMETAACIDADDSLRSDARAWQQVGALENALKHCTSDEDLDGMVTFSRLVNSI